MKVFLRKLKTALSLSFPQWEMTGWAYFYLIKTQFLLLLSSSQSVERALTQERPAKLSNRLNERRGAYKELLSFFRLAWRYQFKKPKCLATSLAQQTFLRHYGFPTQFRIGIRKVEEQLQAHAWCEDKNLDFHPLETFT